jgi:ABC-type Fe3+/spermidine/putrescine transport system ATPase subunit
MTTGPAWLVLRPEVVRLGREHADGLRGVVLDLAFRGSGFSYRIDVSGLPDPLKAELSGDAAPPLEVGSTVAVSWDPGSCGLLPREPD